MASLISYSAIQSGKDSGESAVIDLGELPDTRLQLYKLGISAGIRNRMRIEVQSSAGKEKVEKELKEAEKVMAADYHVIATDCDSHPKGVEGSREG